MTIEKLLDHAREGGEGAIPSAFENLMESLKYTHGGWQGDAFYDYKDLIKGNDEVKQKVVDAFIEGMKKFLDSPDANDVVFDLLDYTDFVPLEEEDENEDE